MNARYVLAAVAVAVPSSVEAEAMLTSYDAAPAPHVAAHRSLPRAPACS